MSLQNAKEQHEMELERLRENHKVGARVLLVRVHVEYSQQWNRSMADSIGKDNPRDRGEKWRTRAGSLVVVFYLKSPY